MIKHTQFTYADLKRICESNGYSFFDSGDYNLNLIGMRDLDAVNTDEFSDVIYLAFRINGDPVAIPFQATTMPGFYYRENPLVPTGVAILPAGQHRALWRIGLHRGKPALTQRRACIVRRDNDGDSLVDINSPYMKNDTGNFLINLHSTGRRDRYLPKEIGKWSAGCQVLRDQKAHDTLMYFVEQSLVRYGNTFTYTLFDMRDNVVIK